MNWERWVNPGFTTYRTTGYKTQVNPSCTAHPWRRPWRGLGIQPHPLIVIASAGELDPWPALLEKDASIKHVKLFIT